MNRHHPSVFEQVVALGLLTVCAVIVVLVLGFILTAFLSAVPYIEGIPVR